jgi:peroxiredoxin family protein
MDTSQPASGAKSGGDDPAARLLALEERVRQLEGKLAEQSVSDRLTMVVFSGDFDRLVAAFIIALGATAYDMQVDLFVTFWGITALRDGRKHLKKDVVGTMFDRMLPAGSQESSLSRMNMAGVGAKLFRRLMRDKGVPSLEDLIREAGQLGVRVHVCEMSMELMRIRREELIDYPDLDVCGVGTFIALAKDSRQTLFI